MLLKDIPYRLMIANSWFLPPLFSVDLRANIFNSSKTFVATYKRSNKCSELVDHFALLDSDQFIKEGRKAVFHQKSETVLRLTGTNLTYINNPTTAVKINCDEQSPSLSIPFFSKMILELNKKCWVGGLRNLAMSRSKAFANLKIKRKTFASLGH